MLIPFGNPQARTHLPLYTHQRPTSLIQQPTKTSHPKTMFFDFLCLSNPSNTWTFNSIASIQDGSVSIPPSPLPNKVIDRVYISNILTASFFLKGIAPAFYKSASTKPVPKITHVLSLVSEKPWHEGLIRKEPKSVIVHKKILVPDRRDANLMDWFPGMY